MPCFAGTTAEEVSDVITSQPTTEKEEVQDVAVESQFTDTPEDIKKVIAQREKTSAKDKKDGSIYEKQYKNEGVILPRFLIILFHRLLLFFIYTIFFS